jgi:hypothetical protein
MHNDPSSFDNLPVFALLANALALKSLSHDTFEPSNSALDGLPIDPAPLRRTLLDHIDDWFWKQSQRELETHARICDLERGVLYRQ